MRRIKRNVLEVYNAENILLFCIEEQNKDEIFRMKVQGRITNEVAEELEDELWSVLLSCKCVELDVSEVTYMASAAAKTLLSAMQMSEERNGGSLQVCGASGAVSELLNEVGV